MLWAILLLGLGLGFIVAEILFPSLGVLTVLAIASLVGSVSMAFAESSAVGVRFLIAVALGAPVAVLLGFKLFPVSPFGRRMVLPGLSFEPSPGLDDFDRGALGREGVAESPLRPAGIARIDGRRVDVVTRGELLDAGTRVRVVEISGNRVVVASSSTAPPNPSSADRSPPARTEETI